MHSNVSNNVGMKRLLILVPITLAHTVGTAQMSHGPTPKSSSTDTRAPILQGLGNHMFPVSTANATAQKLVNQGLLLNYAFNHAEAYRSFTHALEWDKDLAMAHWGRALSLGPHINAAMDAANVPKAWEALQAAIKLQDKATPREKALIRALSKRYVATATSDRSALDAAYAEAMREVVKEYPNDSDALTLCAESLMNLHPWDYWRKDGSPQPWAPEFLGLLEKALAIDPMHPGALHLYIHAVEASPDPYRGTAAADRLQHLTPAAGHLVHMPGHIYIRTGRYEDAANSNLLAIKADDSYLAQCKQQGIYPLMYVPHNWHFLWFARSFQGKSKAGMDAANEMARRIDQKLMVQTGMESMQHLFAAPLYGMARFGLWEDALKAPEPAKDALYVRGVWHFARGLALIRKGSATQAAQEIAALEALRADPKVQAIAIDGMCPAERLMGIGLHILKGEQAAAAKNYDEAVKQLQMAVDLEDQNPYMEPAYWAHSARLVLGAVLVEAGRGEEAEKVYLQDLKSNPENGWALFGLAQAFEKQGRPVEAAKAKARFQLAWNGADLTLASSRK